VVALLKELGTPKSLGTIIEGEALLNDGVAYVLFLLFLERSIGEDISPFEIVGEFFYACVVGSLVGLGLGIVMVQLMGAIFDDHIAEVMLTIVFCWLAFYIGDGILRASGVISVVVLGLCYAREAHSTVSIRALEGIEAVWEAIGFAANTVVFAFAGLLVHLASRVGEEGDEGNDEKFFAHARDYGYLSLFYLLLNVIRFVTHLFILPLLVKTGYGFSWKDVVVSTHGALRGAVGLALALFLVNNPEFHSQTAQEMLFYMGGIVLLTLVVNGSTAETVVVHLGLNRSSASSKRFFQDAQRDLLKHVQDRIGDLKHSEIATRIDWEQVYKHVPILSENMENYVKGALSAENLGEFTPRMQASCDKEVGAMMKSFDFESVRQHEGQESPIVIEARIRFLSLVKAQYVQQYEEEALVKKPLHSILLHSIDLAEDDVAMRALSDWGHLRDHIQARVLQRIAKPLKLLSCDRLTRSLLIHNVVESYQLAHNFIRAHNKAQKHFSEHFVSVQDCVQSVERESKKQVTEAKKFLDERAGEYIEVVRHCETKAAIEHVIQGTSHYAEHLFHVGDINEKELMILLRGVEHTKQRFWRHLKFIPNESPKDAVKKSALFQNVPPTTVDEFVNMLKEKDCFDKHKFMEKGAGVEGITLIAQGKVAVYGPCRLRDTSGNSKTSEDSPESDNEDVLDIISGGGVLGLVEALNDTTCKYTVASIGAVVAMTLPTPDFKKFLFEKEVLETMELRKNIAKICGIQILQNVYNYPKSVSYTTTAVHELFSNCSAHILVDESVNDLPLNNDKAQGDAFVLKIVGEYAEASSTEVDRVKSCTNPMHPEVQSSESTTEESQGQLPKSAKKKNNDGENVKSLSKRASERASALFKSFNGRSARLKDPNECKMIKRLSGEASVSLRSPAFVIVVPKTMALLVDRDLQPDDKRALYWRTSDESSERGSFFSTVEKSKIHAQTHIESSRGQRIMNNFSNQTLSTPERSSGTNFLRSRLATSPVRRNSDGKSDGPSGTSINALELEGQRTL